MAINYSIIIEKIETEDVNGITDVVRRVFWKFKGEDTVTGNIAKIDNVEVFTLKEESWVDAEGNTRTNPVDFDPNNFILYSDLTPAVVEQWIRTKHAENMHIFEEGVNRRIAMLNAKTQQPPSASSLKNLPWAATN